MLYQFAITPDVFEPSAINDMRPPGIILTEVLRGLCENGLLANLHGEQWMTAVRRSLHDKRVPAFVRDRIENFLNTLYDRQRLVRHPPGSGRFVEDEFRWLHWSLERHQADATNPFSGIFCSDDYLELSELDDADLIGVSNALYAACWTERETSIDIIRTTSKLRKHLAPIVRYAGRVSLIDPYMSCHDRRFLDTVQHCADLLGRHDGKQTPGIIHIHAGDPQTVGPEGTRESVDARLDRWETELKPMAAHWGHTFRVLLWARKRTNGVAREPFHDRYIITEQFGVTVPGGLDFLPETEVDRAGTSSWSLMTVKQTRRVIQQELHHAKSPYRYLGTRTVEP